MNTLVYQSLSNQIRSALRKDLGRKPNQDEVVSIRCMLGDTGKWSNWHISRRFMLFLHNYVGKDSFTVTDAYSAYVIYPFRGTKTFKRPDYPSMFVGNKVTVNDEWDEMNVRNNLCASTERGLLTRLERGVYKFNVKELP